MPTKLRLLSKKILWLPLILWLGAICYLSFSSLDKMQLPQFSGVDKLAHLGMYAILELFLFLPLRQDKKTFLQLSFAALAFSAFTELVQHYAVVNRYGDVWDFAANGVGIAIVYFLLKGRIKT